MEPLKARLLVLPATLCLSLAVAATADSTQRTPTTTGKTTKQQTLAQESKSKKGFSFLKAAPGEDYELRQEMAEKSAVQPGREKRRRSIVYFAQLSDFQLADPESPARVETLYALGGTFRAAWRPQETLMPHLIDASIRQVNKFVRSPLKQGNNQRAKMNLAVLTGDNIDNQQHNEAEWMTRLIEGGEVRRGTPHKPSGTFASACPAITKTTPRNNYRYTGVQAYKGPAKLPAFYNPDQPSGPFAAWPQYPGLLDRAKKPFTAQGLKVPSYVVLGNHDGLLQGNSRANPVYAQFATSCLKPFGLFLAPTGSPAEGLALENELRSDPKKAMVVTPDPQRRIVTKEDYKAILASKQKDAHGFGLVDRKELQASHGAASYYAWNPVSNVRFIALDTISEAGEIGTSAEGNLDHPQFLWLKRELDQAKRKNQLVVVFSHHGPESMTANVPDEKAPACTTPPGTRDPNPGCRRDPRSSRPIHLGRSVTDLLVKYPQVVAWVSGHTHVNAVTPIRRKNGGFWGIRTSSESDWPHHTRLIEIMDNRDGTLSIFGTMLHDSSPIKAPASGSHASMFGHADLASIARTFGYNMHSHGKGIGGPGDHSDRNVELVIKDPRRSKR